MNSLKNIVTDNYQMVQILEAKNETEALQLACNNPIRLAIFDIYLDGIKTYEVIRQIKSRHPQMRALIFTGSVSSEIIAAGKSLKVDGYVSKSSATDEFINVINDIMYGKSSMCGRFQKASQLQEQVLDEHSVLTRREKEILDYTLQGLTVSEISKVANISQTTVKKHRQNILRKLNFSSSAKLLAYTKQIQMDNK